MSDTPSKRFSWKFILIVCATLFLLWGLLVPAFYPTRESGPHPKRHAPDSDVKSIEVERHGHVK